MNIEEFSNIEKIFIDNGYKKRNDYCYNKKYSSGIISNYMIYEYPNYFKLVHLLDDELVFSQDFVSVIGMYKELVKMFGNKKGRK